MPKTLDDPVPAFKEPMIVSVIDGEIVISGPKWVHAAFEPEAAQASADRLAVAARKAKADRLLGDLENVNKDAGD